VDSQNICPSVCSSHPVSLKWRTAEKHGERQKYVSRGQITPRIIIFLYMHGVWPKSTFFGHTFNRLHGVISQKTEFLTIAVRTSNPKTKIISDAAVKIVCTGTIVILVLKKSGYLPHT
jgi:hypothetical protein